MPNRTRRDFLQYSAWAAGAAVLSRNSPVWGERSFLSTSPGTQKVRGWVTSGTQRYAQFEAPQWRATSSAASQDIQIDADVHRQSILGFGAAFTDGSCWEIQQLPESERNSLMEEFFGPSGLRFSVCRTCVGSSDYSRSVYSFDDSPTPDPELKHFSIDHDRAYILPTLRAARALNPEMFLFGTPWSPPGWMKAGGSMLGGSMRKSYFSAYADYFVRFLQAYKDAGVPVNAVTVQNEVDTDQDGRMPACLWGQEYEEGFVAGYLGPALQKAGLDTKIWFLDHNYNLAGRVLDVLSNRDFNKYVDGIAWHGYVGNVDAMSRVHDAYPDKNAYWTEGGPDFTKADYATDWSNWSQTFTGVLQNWGRCLVGWNFALDEQGKPNLGPFDCGGMVTIHSATRKITRSGQYWAFAHYSKEIQRNARVLASKGGAASVDHIALENPDGSHVLVLTNKGEARTVDCGFGGSTLSASMPSDSVATLVW